jgi:hypothetical protein
LVFHNDHIPGALPQAVLTERRWRALNILQRFNDGSNDAFWFATPTAYAMMKLL